MFDYGPLYQMIGDAIISFVQVKPTPFPGMLLSKESFWKCPKWKRAMVFVFLVRHVLEMTSQKMWARFTYADYRVNKRCFTRYMKKDQEIMERSLKYQKLPETTTEKVVSKRKKTGYSSFSEESPVKRRLKIGDDTTTDEEN